MDKISVLIQQTQKLFHTSDLQVIWSINKESTLYQTIYRLIKKKILFRVQKGLYSIIPLDQLDPIEIGFRLINRLCYLSTETVLSENGIINQSPNKITYISSISKVITINNQSYLYRQMNPIFLNNTLGIYQKENGLISATIERAVADMLYFQPSYHFDADKIIDWKKVKIIQQEIGYL